MEDEQREGPALLLGGDINQGGPMILQEEADVNMDAAAEEDKGPMPGPEEQAAVIEQLEDKQIAEGETLYIISKRWWGDWCSYTNYKNHPNDSSSSETDADSSPPPMEIDNSDIVDNNTGDLKQNLQENEDFVIATAQSWDKLHGWYGGGPALSRPAVMEGLLPSTKRPRVMLYNWKLDVVWSGQPTEIKTIEAAPNETVSSLKERACKAFSLETTKVDIWDFFQNSKHAKLENSMDRTLSDARILDEQTILLDDKDKPLEDKVESSSSPIITTNRGFGRAHSFTLEDSTVQRTDGRPGLVGLQNLGNTCFMNSSLQCLMHSVPILSVFLSGTYEADLNTSNPLGMKGQLATAFGSLMGKVWRPEVGTVVPRGFKSKIAQFAPQFSGYAQHDSQEFLAFLLDGLHEDVNRIQNKPYIQEPDSEGVRDEQLAALAWANYRARNDSHIVDHFQGLLKSTLVCPQCSYSSVKFDPFMYLSLPLPESRVRQLTAILLHGDGLQPPREYGLEVPQTGTVKDLCVALARVAGLTVLAPEQQMVAGHLTTTYNSYNLNVFDDPKARLSEVWARDKEGALLVYYYQRPEHGPAGQGNKKVLVFHNRSAGWGLRRPNAHTFFSAPLLLWLPPEQTYDPMLHVVSTVSSGAPAAAATAASSGGGSSSSKFDHSPASNKDTEYIITEDAPIWTHIQRMLRPFLAVPLLRQQPAAEQAGDAAGDAAADAMQQEDQQQQQQPQQQPAGSGGPDVSMAAASGLPGSPVVSPSPEPCCTSQLLHEAAATAAAGEAADGATKAASEAGENNSTWGSHGSDSPRSEMDLGGLDETAAAAVGDEAAAAAAALGEAAAAADAAPQACSPQVQSDGELDATAAFAMQELQELNSVLDSGAPAGIAASGAGILGGGVPVEPLDIWAAQQQHQATTTTPATTPPGSTTAAEGIGPAVGSSAAGSSYSWPPYQLKLARDDHNHATAVPSWNSALFHPHVHHYTYVLDWDIRSGYTVSHDEYMEAVAAAEAAAEDGNQQQQQQQQEQHQQEQQQGGSNSGSGSSLDSYFWVPDLTGVGVNGMPLSEQEQAPVEVCGDYCVNVMQSPEYDPSTVGIKASRLDRKTVTLEACVDAYLQPEQLSVADEWYCPKCKQHVQADKKLDLWSLPEVLVVHLKRFSYTRWNRDKLDTEVLFPLQQLDLSRYVLHAQEQPPIYDCYAVSNHYGGLGGGHYTAFAQMPDDKKWYCFDDSRVEEMTAEGVQTKAAYMLFYRRRQQLAQDPPSLVEDLLFQRQQQLEQKRLRQQEQRDQGEAAAAAAAAAAAVDGLQPVAATPTKAAEMEMDTPAVFAGPDAAAAAAANAAAAPDSPGGIWGSPAPRANAAAAAGGAGAGAVDDAGATGMASSAPASPITVLPELGRGRVGNSIAAAARGADSTSTSTGGAVGGDGDDDSSDGSSSRPRRGQRGMAQHAWQQQQQQHQHDAGSWEQAGNWAALQVDSGAGQEQQGASLAGLAAAAVAAAVQRRPSDQDVDADMADRDA